MYDKRIVVGLLMLGLLLAAEPVMAQQGIGGISPNQPTESECDSKNRTWGSGPTFIASTSEVCAFAVAGDIGQATGKSDITACPTAWNSLEHSVSIILDQSGFIQVCTAYDEEGTSGTPANAFCSGPHSSGISYLQAQGDHVYQVARDDPDDTRLVETEAFLELGM